MEAKSDEKPETKTTPEEEPKTDTFEVMTAFLLGLAAIGAALASLQSGQWGGRQLEAFSQSNTLTTIASRDYAEAVSYQNADYAVFAQAKQLLIEAAEAETEQDEQRKLRMVSYLYTQQLTWQAMKALGLPEAMWTEEQAESAEGGEAASAEAAPAAVEEPAVEEPAVEEAAVEEAAVEEAAVEEEPAVEGEAVEGETVEEETEEDAAAEGEVAAEAPAEVASAESTGEAEVDAAMANMLPEELLWDSLDIELSDEDSTYSDDLFTEPLAQFEAADARFEVGQTANNNGDAFDLAGVYYTVALFFAGLGLVFKSRARWPFFGLGALIFAATSVFMATLPWASCSQARHRKRRHEPLPIELRNALGDVYPDILAVVLAELDVKAPDMNKIISQLPANALGLDN